MYEDTHDERTLWDRVGVAAVAALLAAFMLSVAAPVLANASQGSDLNARDDDAKRVALVADEDDDDDQLRDRDRSRDKTGKTTANDRSDKTGKNTGNKKDTATGKKDKTGKTTFNDKSNKTGKNTGNGSNTRTGKDSRNSGNSNDSRDDS